MLVGNRGDSETYVRSKKKACEEVGIKSFACDLPENVSQEELLKVSSDASLIRRMLDSRLLVAYIRNPRIVQVVEEFNANPAVHGILVQLPLPKHINEQQILDLISLDKDVDGFHPLNIGSLAMRGRQPNFISCTPKAWHPPDAPLPAMHLKWSTW